MGLLLSMMTSMLRVRASLLISAVVALLATTLNAPLSSASTGEAAAFARVLGQPTLKVEGPSPYLENDFPTLQFATFEDRDGLPHYAVTVTELASGQQVPLGFGYATGPSTYSTSNYEGPYQVDTTAQLAVGATYEAKMSLTTVSYWTCSIYHPDGCYRREGGTDTWYWRFTYTGETTDAAIYDPPPPPPPPTPPAPPKEDVTFKVVNRGPYGKHALTFTWVVQRDGVPLKRARVTGEWGFRGGKWTRHKTFRTDARGRLSLWLSVKPKRSEPTKYRLVFAGNSTTNPVDSKPVKVRYRR